MGFLWRVLILATIEISDSLSRLFSEHAIMISGGNQQHGAQTRSLVFGDTMLRSPWLHCHSEKKANARHVYSEYLARLSRLSTEGVVGG